MKSREIQKFWKTGLGVLTVPFVPDAGNCTWLVSLLLLGLPRAACGWGGCQLPQASQNRGPKAGTRGNLYKFGIRGGHGVGVPETC